LVGMQYQRPIDSAVPALAERRRRGTIVALDSSGSGANAEATETNAAAQMIRILGVIRGAHTQQ
jgi:hypothetical protein